MCAYLIEMSVLSPEILLSLAACVLLMIGAFTKSTCFRVLNATVAVVVAVAAYLVVYQVPSGEVFAFDGLFKTSYLIKILKLLLLTSSIFYIILYKGQKFQSESMLKFYEFPVLLLLAVTGMLLMISANNFLSLYVSLELQSFCLYVLAAFEREDSKASEAGLKYFVLGSFASGILLFGISLIYGFTGNLDYQSLQILLSNNPSSNVAIGIIIGIIMLLIGVFFKISAAPFHMWTPDVYQGSPTIVTTFFASVAKVGAVGLLLRLTLDVFEGWKLELQPILVLVTCASVLIGSIGALKQSNIKRLMAYSSIGHVGYILLAIASFSLIDTGVSVIKYLIIYVSMTLGTFAMIMNIQKNGKFISNIEDLAGLSKSNPWTAATMAIFMFSLAGIPPLAGFFAKFYVFQAALNAKIYLSVAASMVAAVISAYYYLKIVKIIYLDELKDKFTIDMSYSTKFIIWVLALFNLFYVVLASN